MRAFRVLALATAFGLPLAAQAAAPLAIRGDVLLQADELDYDVDAHIVTARGHV